MELTREAFERLKAADDPSIDPVRHDFRWSEDGCSVTVIPLTWWDDASYARYQGDPDGDRE